MLCIGYLIIVNGQNIKKKSKNFYFELQRVGNCLYSLCGICRGTCHSRQTAFLRYLSDLHCRSLDVVLGKKSSASRTNKLAA